ncbi:DUF475 domain-containing protein [Alkanindiges illinoisensis]|uniref:DUF475 domain-containing protein n=1 Tax=Alkanindiges illinoisensis TaxID=197183 RepID=A0A4Y7X961_9GAMM|nr:DUF475 domain-containing protein [Alkanindiges illinoisensis]TEU23393.1 DUF475 domain-containing protein [Alkanindiges illinoisensis]
MQHFRFSFIFSFVCLGLAFWWGLSHGSMSTAFSALAIVGILAVMEVSLSFDNAVVNASILKHWDQFWKTLFLTVGMIIAVFGMRLVFPLVIVAVTADMGMVEVAQLALNDPKTYSAKLMEHHSEIAAFGGMFLLLVFLNFLFDADKEVHWYHWLETKLSILGRSGTAATLVALLALIAALRIVPENMQFAVFMAGIWGIVVYQAVDLLSSILEGESHDAEDGVDIGKAVQRGGIAGFIYLEVLDASFSFDGVIGAFAITSDVVIIMLGLAIGAMFVRSMTIYLVEKGTLDEFIYLEHGAHYAIGALAIIMLMSMHFHIPELVTGLIGVAFIGWSLWASIVHRRKASHDPVN